MCLVLLKKREFRYRGTDRGRPRWEGRGLERRMYEPKRAETAGKPAGAREGPGAFSLGRRPPRQRLDLRPPAAELADTFWLFAAPRSVELVNSSSSKLTETPEAVLFLQAACNNCSLCYKK